MVLQAQSLLFCNFINAIAYHLSQDEPPTTNELHELALGGDDLYYWHKLAKAPLSTASAMIIYHNVQRCQQLRK